MMFFEIVFVGVFGADITPSFPPAKLRNRVVREWRTGEPWTVLPVLNTAQIGCSPMSVQLG